MSKHTSVLGEPVLTFPHMPFSLEVWEDKKQKADQSTNVDRAELLKHFWKPSRPHPTNPQVSFLSPGFQKAGREHVLHVVFSGPHDGPWHSSFGQINGGGTAGSSSHFSALDKLCKLDQQGHSQPLGGWAVILLHAITALPPSLSTSLCPEDFSL